MMKGAYAEITSRLQRPHEFDLPRVLIAAPCTAPIARALSDAGYVVGSTSADVDVLRNLRNQRAIELLVLDGSEKPWTVGSIIESARAINRALPIILISGSDA